MSCKIVSTFTNIMVQTNDLFNDIKDAFGLALAGSRKILSELVTIDVVLSARHNLLFLFGAAAVV